METPQGRSAPSEGATRRVEGDPLRTVVRSAIEAIPLVAWMVDSRGTFTLGNARWCDCTGLSEQFGRDRAWSPAVGPDEESTVRSAWTRGLAGRVGFEIACRAAVCPDGPFARGVIRVQPLESVGWLVSWQEQGASSSREAEPPVENERLVRALEAAGVGLWYCNLPFERLIWDRTCKEHFGLPADAEVSIETFYDRLHPADRERTRDSIERAIADGMPMDIEYRTLGAGFPTGRWIRALGRAFYDPSGRPVRFDGVTVDITRRKQAEHARQQLAMVVERSSDLVVLARLDVQPWYVNPAGLSLLGLPDLDVVRRTGVLEFVAEPDRVRVRDEVIPAVQETGRWSGELRLRNFQTGAMIPIVFDAFRVDDAVDGEPLCLAGIGRDISVQKRVEDVLIAARKKAEEASRARDRLLAMLGHELRTPLTPVLLAAGEMLADPSTPAGHRDLLELVRRNITAEARLIDDLLDFRSGVGATTVPVVPTSAHAQVHAVVGNYQPELAARNVSLHLQLESPDDGLLIDPTRLQKVFAHLLINAAKFTPAGGTIRVTTRGNDGRLTVEVEDSGEGIQPSDLLRIFEPFVQLGSHNGPGSGGLGLGLTISRAIVEAHGGTLLARSAGRGLGATFLIELPLASGPVAPSLASLPSSATPAPARPLNILFVEDDEMTSRVLGRLLRHRGHRVSTAASLAEALEAASSSEPFDLVISDVGLPDGSGLDLMRTLRTRLTIPGIALTGFGTDSDHRRSSEAGFVVHLTKPVDFETLDATIRQVVVPRGGES